MTRPTTDATIPTVPAFSRLITISAARRRLRAMELPRLTTVHGAYVYFLATLIGIVCVFALYLLAVWLGLGLAPGPTHLGTVVRPPVS